MWSIALLALFLQTSDPQAEGIKALEQQRYDAAAELFQKAVAANPKDYGAHFHLALANSLIGKDDMAISGYQKVLELKPGLYEAELNLGILLLRQNQPGEAVKVLESAARQKPKEFRPVNYHAEALLRAGNASAAETQFRAAAEIDPKAASAALGLARSLARQQKLADAAPLFEKAAELDPTFKDALLELASLYEANKQLKEAAVIYGKFPENAAARERLGELLLESGESAQAIPQLEAAVNNSPTTANRYALAHAYVSNKQVQKALPLLEDALKAEPGHIGLRAMYGRSLRELKRYPGAAEQFLLVAKSKPQDAEASSDLAGMLVLIERYPEALGALDRVRALNGEKPGHHFLRAIVLDKNQAAEGALASYQKFLELSEGKYPDEEFKARQRVKILTKEVRK